MTDEEPLAELLGEVLDLADRAMNLSPEGLARTREALKAQYAAELEVIKGAMAAHVDSFNVMAPGRLLCSCGRQFPARIPEGWRPESYTVDEWAVADQDEKDAQIRFAQVRSHTAAEDVAVHQAQMVLIALAEVRK